MGQDTTGNGVKGDSGGGSYQSGNETLSVPEAARRLGKSPDAIRAALRRGTLAGFHGNDKDWRVLASALPEAALNDSEAAALRQELDRTRAELETWRRQAEDGRVTAAELRTRAELLQQALDRELARSDRLEAELRELRKPWWQRWLSQRS